ncbi:hypothetical protein K432DRAFT_447552 [Lepidopterella palustris CBS 459.81]|uniref:Uncharacterized protein n=1 Tax=Lepidopterella palustris CBS 459.81 TaxID=1314670 RepID=A0A8E2DYG3_9PEZI|nr:hypothetical protein K432DRAFT_447552 [Lepidopterella palustris CBS 459.81]
MHPIPCLRTTSVLIPASSNPTSLQCSDSGPSSSSAPPGEVVLQLQDHLTHRRLDPAFSQSSLIAPTPRSGLEARKLCGLTGRPHLPPSMAAPPKRLRISYTTRCNHPLHPGSIMTNLSLCPVCVVLAGLADLEAARQEYDYCGGPWSKSTDLVTGKPNTLSVWLIKARSAWLAARRRVANDVEKFEDWAEFESAWEAKHPAVGTGGFASAGWAVSVGLCGGEAEWERVLDQGVPAGTGGLVFGGENDAKTVVNDMDTAGTTETIETDNKTTKVNNKAQEMRENEEGKPKLKKKVRFDTCMLHLPSHTYRKQDAYHRGSSKYRPGIFACVDGEGWADTSWAGDHHYGSKEWMKEQREKRKVVRRSKRAERKMEREGEKVDMWVAGMFGELKEALRKVGVGEREEDWSESEEETEIETEMEGGCRGGGR